MSMDFYVSTLGNDEWSGRLGWPNADNTDGPFATISKARDTIRESKIRGGLPGPVTVWIRDGRYHVSEAICFKPDDSAPVTFSAYMGEHPILDGGKAIDGWHEEKINGIKVWSAYIPEVAEGKWYFHQLFVNGERRSRTRLPKQGFYWIEDVPDIDFSTDILKGSEAFRCREGDVKSWRNITDIDVVVPHYWIEERMPIASFDDKGRIVKSSRRSIFALKDDIAGRYARYYVENVFEALTEPGEWYLDRLAGKVCYIPMPGEELGNTVIYAPSAKQMLKLEGDPDKGRFVEFLRFRGLTFENTDWVQPAGGGGFLTKEFGLPDIDYAAAHQSAFNVPGALSLKGARYCTIEKCLVRHVGGYGIEISEGCMGNGVTGNEITDMGAGGIKLNGSDALGPVASRTGNNRVTDNHIHSGGHVFHSAAGILAAHSFGNDISHNHIHDLYYSGISCGWIWGYNDSVSMNNRIEKNHIHNLGYGLLSDLGGIYALGVQPGTVIRGNIIHDIEKCNYGGWAIYLDEGSSHMLVENNLCYNTSSQGFHQHFGRENIVRNNIFAFGREGQILHSRAEQHTAFTFERNIVLSDGQPFFVGGYAGQLEKRNFISDLNLFWDVSGAEFACGNGKSDKNARWIFLKTFSAGEWRELGYDRYSKVADPVFRDCRKYDFTLMDGSPAFLLGFKPFDNSDAGPRPIVPD